MAAPLLVLALEFHRAPLAFRHLIDSQRPLPEAFGDWLIESSAALAPAHIQATADALGTSPQNLRDAYLFFLRQVLLIPEADHYRILGLTRNCSSETIKQHHGLLVRLFHPDRSQEDGERSGVLTARINHAHQVLRDPQARRLYDRRLPSLRGGEGSNGGAADFFRPHGSLVPAGPQDRTPTPLRSRTRWPLFWTLTCVGTAALVYAFLREPLHPVLRANPDLVGENALGPFYIQGGAASGHSPETRGPASPEPSDAPSHGQPAPLNAVLHTHARDDSAARKPGRAADELAVAESRRARQADNATASRQSIRPELARTAETAKMPDPAAREPAPAVRRSPPQRVSGIEGPKEAKPMLGVPELPREGSVKRPGRGTGVDAANLRAASELVGRLERSFADGDLAGLVNLFTANAVVNGGIGAAGIRKAYREFIGQGGQRRMTLSGLSWRPGQYERLLGRGAIGISTRPGPQSDWSHAAGTVDIEIVPAIGEFRISKLTYHLSRK